MSKMESTCPKKLIRSKSGLRIVAVNDNFKSPFTLCEPPWIPDNESTNCTECNIKFDFIKRRHHCRRCGKIYCSSCCDTKVRLPRMCFVDPVRVCFKCASVTNKENDFFGRQLKTLINGATFLLDGSDTVETNTTQYLICKLSQNHRHLVFEGALSDGLNPVQLNEIKAIGVSKNENTGMSSVDIVYSGKEQTGSRLKLHSGPEPYRKVSNAWILAIHQAFKMMYERQSNNE